MLCSLCRHPNRDADRACVQCGAALVMQLPESQAPREIIGGRFRLLALIGEGGMGRVYLAEQPMGRTLRKVAIKTLHAHYAREPEVIARFERECSLVCQLEHPNTIQFFDYGQSQNGDLFIVMEYVEGNSLADILEAEAPLSQERVVFILHQICGALEEAHRRGIVHRDLKPQNIMLTTRAGQADFVKLLDFGIAKSQSSEGAQASLLTQQGTVLGTPAYMSPEQFRGGLADTRSDIYSLGLIAYEMLTGKRPFHSDTPWGWATQHMTAEPLPFEAHAVAARTPHAMKTAILRALAKDPSERQASARQLLVEMTSGVPPVSAISSSTVVRPAAAARVQESTVYEAPNHGDNTQMALPEAATDKAVVIPPNGKRAGVKNGHVRKLVLALGTGCIAVIGIAKVFGSDPSNEIAPSPAASSTRTVSMAESMRAAIAAQSGATGSCSGMATIPGGDFRMGDRGAFVSVLPFCLDYTEVTVDAYAKCVESGRCSANNLKERGCTYGVAGKEAHPITCVDWLQATTYCHAKGKRLPTEEEWEWAARGGDEGRIYPWGNSEPHSQLCWSGIEERSGACPVGSFPEGRNRFGALDLAGNVWEWTSSTHGASGRVTRGGSFSRSDASSMRAANRGFIEPTNRFGYLGFRCAKSR